MERRSKKSCGDVRYDAPVVERGVGFFETVLLAGRRAVLWDKHLDRLFSTLLAFELPKPLRSEVQAEARRAIEAAKPGPMDERGLRVAWIAIGDDVDLIDSWRLDVTVRAIPQITLWRRNGSNAISLPADFARDSPGVKSTSYFSSVMGLRRAKKRGGDEAFFVTPDGSYLEGTSTALVGWNGGELVMPLRGTLPSVTAGAFMPKRYTTVPLTTDILRAGAVLLGSLTMAAPLLSLDGTPCAQPAQMLSRVRDFNRQLLQEATWGHVL